MKKLLSSLFILLLFVATAMAQERTIKGTVKGKDDGLPLPGVTVRVKGSTIGTQTGQNGQFSIRVNSGSAVLMFAYVGYTSLEVAVGGKSEISVLLESDQKQLSEVVVTAMGISRSAKSLGYAVTQVAGAELTKARETNVLNSLAGKVAGVRVTSQSGTLGGSAKINIRGVSSLGSDPYNNQPIFVIDGLPVDNGAPQVSTVSGAVPQGSAGADFGNRASDISADDIESMTVLKGAAATALYGARAKNGAIVITTKRGAKGQTSVTLNSSVRFDNVLKLPKFQNEYAQGTYGVYSIQNTNGWGPKISEVQDKQYANFLGQQVTLQAYPDNVKEFFETGNSYINSVAFDGGGESGDYRFGYTNTYQDGIVPGQKLQKNTLALNAGRTVAKGFDVRTNFNYTRTVGDGRPVQSSNNPNVIVPLIYGMPRTVDMGMLRDNYVDPVTGQQITLTPSRNGNNPFWIVKNNNFSNRVDRLYGNAIFTYTPAKWLTLSNNLGTDYYAEFRRGITRQGTIGALTGNFFTANVYNRVINNDFLATINTKLADDLDLKVIAGHNVYETYYQREQSDAQSLTADNLYNFANAASVVTTNTSNKKRIIGVYGDIGLSYKDYLFLNITGRNDWSSALPKANRSYFYPSVSSSFVFSEILPKNDWFSYGKLRASWANVGSDTYPYRIAFDFLPLSTSFAQYGYGSTFPFNGLLAFSSPSSIPNFNLKPQNQKTWEVGTDLRFFNSRVNLDVTYYYANTTDQILSVSLPQSTGFAARVMNAGALKNQGIEVGLGLIPVKNQNFQWNMDLNFSANRQRVTLPEGLSFYTIASGWSGLTEKAVPGEPFKMYGVAWDRDPAGNIIIDPATGLRKIKSDQPLGNIYPDWIGGISNSFRYKNASLSFLVDIRKGGVLFSSTASSLRTAGLAEETLANRGNIFIDRGVLDQGNGVYVENNIPVQSMQDFWGQFSTSNTEANVFDASYAKLREVRFSYALPKSLFAKSAKFIKGMEIGLEGRNLWIIKDNVPHIDPEVNFFGSESVGEGVEFASMPSTRTWGFNLRVKL